MMLTGLEHVRKKPGMYIGHLDERGLQTCVMEVLARSFEEWLSGECTRIEVVLHKDGSISVQDNGVGPSLEIDRTHGLPGIELELTTINWFPRGRAYRPHMHFGMTGVGPRCVNAVSATFHVQVARKGVVHEIRFRQGKTSTGLHVIRQLKDRRKTSTTFYFKPNPKIFGASKINFDKLALRLQEIAFLAPGLEIRLGDAKKLNLITYRYTNGLTDFIRERVYRATLLHDPPIVITGKKCGISVEIAVWFSASWNFQMFSYVNLWPTGWGGTDTEGVLRGIADAVNAHVGWDHDNFSVNDVRQGLTCVLSVKMLDPKYFGAVKERLCNAEVFEFVRKLTAERLKRLFKSNRELHLSILQHLGDVQWRNNEIAEEKF